MRWVKNCIIDIGECCNRYNDTQLCAHRRCNATQSIQLIGAADTFTSTVTIIAQYNTPPHKGHLMPGISFTRQLYGHPHAPYYSNSM